jgi:hypothetical protein
VPWVSLVISAGWVAVYVVSSQTDSGHASWPRTASWLLHSPDGKHLVPYAGLLLPLAGPPLHPAPRASPPTRPIFSHVAGARPRGSLRSGRGCGCVVGHAGNTHR